jgi:hypothetical protein
LSCDEDGALATAADADGEVGGAESALLMCFDVADGVEIIDPFIEVDLIVARRVLLLS